MCDPQTTRSIRARTSITIALAWTLAAATTVTRAADPLPSWNDGVAKRSIVEFVAQVTKRGSPDFEESHIGELAMALDEATAKGWTVVDMKLDWNKVFAFQK